MGSDQSLGLAILPDSVLGSPSILQDHRTMPETTPEVLIAEARVGLPDRWNNRVAWTVSNQCGRPANTAVRICGRKYWKTGERKTA